MRSSNSVEQGLNKVMEFFDDNFDNVFKSITSDNSSDFSTLKDFLQSVSIYFTHHFPSFERAINEKQNFDNIPCDIAI